MIQKSPNPEGLGPVQRPGASFGPLWGPREPYRARWAFGPRERSPWGRWAGICEHARQAFRRNRQDNVELMYYVLTLLGLFTCTSSFDIIGATKPLSCFQLTSLSGPTARTGDGRRPFRLILLYSYILQI